MDDLARIVAVAGLVGAGLIGGTLFAFSTFIMAALRRLEDDAGARAMQVINRTIYTPWFMVPFFGTAVLSVAAIVLGLLDTGRSGWLGLVVGGACYALGVFTVTAACNVPLNQRLDRMDAGSAEATAFWPRYDTIWRRWNHLRVIASIGSMIAFGLAV